MTQTGGYPEPDPDDDTEPDQPTTIEDRITEIAQAHSLQVGQWNTRCSCGLLITIPYRKRHAAHVARVLVTELELQPDPASEHISMTRYITPWEDA